MCSVIAKDLQADRKESGQREVQGDQSLLGTRQKVHFLVLQHFFLYISEKSTLEKFLALGVAASVAIIVGGLVVFIVCVAAVVCCCRKCFCKPDLSNSSGTALTQSPLVPNGNPTVLHGNGNAQQDRGRLSLFCFFIRHNLFITLLLGPKPKLC